MLRRGWEQGRGAELGKHLWRGWSSWSRGNVLPVLPMASSYLGTTVAALGWI